VITGADERYCRLIAEADDGYIDDARETRGGCVEQVDGGRKLDKRAPSRLTVCNQIFPRHRATEAMRNFITGRIEFSLESAGKFVLGRYEFRAFH